MPSNLDVIREAMAILGVLDELQTPSAEQSRDGLSIMNDMLSMWEADFIDTGYYQQTDVNATSPVYADALTTVKYNLAIHLAPLYGTEPSLPAVMIADRGYKRLLRDAINSKMQEADMTGIPLGEGFKVRTNIFNDT